MISFLDGSTKKKNGRLSRNGGARLVFIYAVVGVSFAAFAEDKTPQSPNYRWQAGAINHAQRMRVYRDTDRGAQPTPTVIPRFGAEFDPSGRIATFHPNGPTQTAQSAFFKNLGSNGRTCLTCHQPQNNWSVSAASVQSRFDQSSGADPIFRLVDGANCPTADVSSLDTKRKAYSLLLSKGLIRIGLPIPDQAEFSVSVVNDPYSCNTNSATGLTSPTSGIMSVYRRPLSATNLGFLATIMWDGREPNLASQAVDATLGHAQANAAPTAAQQADIVNFESDLFTAQIFDNNAGALNSDGVGGGPVTLQQLVSGFYIGINDAFGGNPTGLPFTPKIFDLYKSWENLRAGTEDRAAREAVARGEQVFNSKKINITGVGGLNDLTHQPSIPGVCGTCHSTPDVGDLSVNFLLNIGLANPQSTSAPSLDVADLPTFKLQCVSGPLAGASYAVTDPGRALISGKCEDIAKFKSPVLRGLAGRAPYFHNGSAATLMDVVVFYDQRFGIGFTEQERNDLVAFLKTL